MSESCEPHHDLFGTLLTVGLVGGLFASYVPQHFRIINKGSSEGFSPWFLLLGSTSSAAGMLNMWTLQWGVVRCCQYISTGSCLESLGGVIQVSLQWFLFTVILALYMMYYPQHLKYAEVDIDTFDERGIQHVKTNLKTDPWRLSVTLTWITVLHMLFSIIVTVVLLRSTSPDQAAQVSMWATFLGVTSASFAAIQYYPQLMHTYRLKLVGALSIPMMIIQSPGGALMAISIALRPGTDWTSWIMYAVSCVMQAILLVMCLFWKARQRRLGIDDFGHALVVPAEDEDGNNAALDRAIADAVEDELDSPALSVGEGRVYASETAPLLRTRSKKKKGVLGWLRR